MKTRGPIVWALGATTLLLFVALDGCTPPQPATGQQIVCDCVGRAPGGTMEVALPDGTQAAAGAAEGSPEAWRIARCAPSITEPAQARCAVECSASRPAVGSVAVAGARIVPGAQSCVSAKPLVADQVPAEGSAAGFVVAAHSSVTVSANGSVASPQPQGEVFLAGGRCAPGAACPFQIRSLVLRVPTFRLAGRDLKNFTIQTNSPWDGLRNPDGSIEMRGDLNALVVGTLNKSPINMIYALTALPDGRLELGPGTTNTMTLHMTASTAGDSTMSADLTVEVALPEGRPEARISTYVDPTDNRVILDARESLNALGQREDFAQYRWFARYGDRESQAEIARGALVKLPNLSSMASAPLCVEVRSARGFAGVACLDEARLRELESISIAIPRRTLGDLGGDETAGCGRFLARIAGVQRFARLVRAAGLEPFVDAGAVTVIAPRDNVLAADPAAEQALLAPDHAAALRHYVLSHMIPQYGVRAQAVPQALSYSPLASGLQLANAPSDVPGRDSDIACDRAAGVVHIVDADIVSIPASDLLMTPWRGYEPAPMPICL